LAEKAKQSDVTASLALKRDKSALIDTIDLTDTVKQQIAGTAPINSVPYGVMNGAYTPYITYQHSRGDSEMIGDSTYNYHDGCVVGFYEQMTNYTVFNKFEAGVFASTTTSGLEWKIFTRDTNAVFDASVETAVASGTLDYSAVSHDSAHTTTLKLTNPVFVPANKYVFVLFRAISGRTTITRWTTNPNSDRHGLLYGTTDNSWAGALSKGSAAYYQGSIKLYMESEELKKYTPPGTDLTPVYTKIDQRTLSRIMLPDEMVAVVGDKLQVFTRGFIESQNPYNEPYEMVSTIGKAYPRYYELTPAAGDVGTKQLTVNIKDKQGNVVTTKTCNIIVKNPIGQPAAQKNVLCVGDSLTEGMIWTQETYRRLTQSGGSPTGLGYGNINFIGNKAFPNYPTQKAVGYGGWSINTYLGYSGTGAAWVNSNPDSKDSTDQKSIYVDTNGKQWQLETMEATRIKVIPSYGGSGTLPSSGTLTWVSGGNHHGTITYTTVTPEATTPFWDSVNNKFSFKAFCDSNGYSGIDVIYILLGWNGLVLPNKSLGSDHAENIGSMKTMIDTLHAEYPNALVRVLGLQVPSPLGGIGTNYDSQSNYSYYNYLRSANGWNLGLQDMVNGASYSSFCKFISVAAQFDSEYSYPETTTAVNSRNTVTERMQTNSIHPANNGYYQIADAVYRDFIRNYCS
jgi:hypothetical protein